jgi:predicted transcriptional regulator
MDPKLLLMMKMEDFEKEIQENTGKQLEALKEKAQKSLKELQENNIKQVKELNKNIQDLKNGSRNSKENPKGRQLWR